MIYRKFKWCSVGAILPSLHIPWSWLLLAMIYLCLLHYDIFSYLVYCLEGKVSALSTRRFDDDASKWCDTTFLGSGQKLMTHLRSRIWWARMVYEVVFVPPPDRGRQSIFCWIVSGLYNYPADCGLSPLHNSHLGGGLAADDLRCLLVVVKSKNWSSGLCGSLSELARPRNWVGTNGIVVLVSAVSLFDRIVDLLLSLCASLVLGRTYCELALVAIIPSLYQIGGSIAIASRCLSGVFIGASGSSIEQ